jgi:hypothetical protein
MSSPGGFFHPLALVNPLLFAGAGRELSVFGWRYRRRRFNGRLWRNDGSLIGPLYSDHHAELGGELTLGGDLSHGCFPI